MITIKLNHQVVKAKLGQTILDVATKNGVDIPTLCHLPRRKSKDNPRAVCRICVVEVKETRGLVASCSAKVRAGMEVFTHSQPVVEARRVLMEFILAENNGGFSKDSEVMRLCHKLGVDKARFSIPSASVYRHVSEYFKVDLSLCVHCDRCIEACDSRHVISRTGFGQGVSTTFGGEDGGVGGSDCSFCGDCVYACPAGGITRLRA